MSLNVLILLLTQVEKYLKSFVIKDLSTDETFPDNKFGHVRKKNGENFGSASEYFKRSCQPISLKISEISYNLWRLHLGKTLYIEYL